MLRLFRLPTARLWLCAWALYVLAQLGHTVAAQTGLTLTQPTYNCATGAITFNTTGGNGTPITYSAAGISRSDAGSNNGTVEAGLRADPKPIVITATQSGMSTSYAFDLASFCATPSNRPPVFNGSLPVGSGTVGRTLYYYIPTGAFVDPEGETLTYSGTGMPEGVVVEPTTGTVYGTATSPGFSLITIIATDPRGQSARAQFVLGVNPAGSTFALAQPTYNCSTGAITFNTTGSNGGPITYTAPGITRNDPGSATGTVEPGLRADPKPIIITATQGGAIATYVFDIASFCAGGGPVTPPPAFSGTLGSTTGTVGQSFSYTIPNGSFSATAGQSLTYAASGLPGGLTINRNTGAITGTPTTAGSNTVVITATSSATSTTVSSGTSTTGTSGTGTSGTATVGQSATASLGIVISSSVTSGTSTTGTSGTGTSGGTAFAGTLGSATGTVGQSFSYTIPNGSFSATAGQSLTYAASGLPPGLAINRNTGAITGTPTTAGSNTVIITATSSATSTTVSSGTSTTGTSGTGTSGTATVGQSFSGTLGILINASVTSGTGTSGTGTTGTAFVGTLGSATGTVGQSFSYTIPSGSFSATAGQSLTYSASGLPPGLTINTGTGAITGTPTTAGSNTVIITAITSGTSTTVSSGTSTTGTSGTGTSGTATTGQSFSGTLGILINSSVTSGTGTAPVFSGTLASATATVGQAFTYTLPTGAFTSPTGQSLTYNASGVPLGLSVNAATGAISGTPTQAGNSAVVIFATNPSGQSASALLGITVNPGTSTTGTSGTAFVGTLGSATGTVGQSFSYTIPTGSFTATTGQSLTYAATGLPAGLTISPGTGAITGTPTTAGSNTVVITATSSASSTSGTSGTGTSGTATVGGSASGTLGIVINSSVTSGTSTTGTSGTGTSGTGIVFNGPLTSVTGTVGQAFSYTLPTGTFTGGQSVSYAATGLPAGLTINGATGAISGTPTAAGSNTVVIRATPGSSTSGTSGTGTSGTATVGQSASGTLGITISSSVTSGTSTTGTSGTGTSGTAPVFSGSLVSATGVVGRAFSYTLPTGTFTAGGSQTLTYAATGLPAGLSINAATGTISGTPTAAGSNTVVIVASTGSSSSGTSGTGTSGTATSGTATGGTSTVGQSASGTVTITISASSASGRLATVDLNPIGITAVGGNPVSNGIVEVAVTGIAGEPVQVLLTDSKGQIIGQQRRERGQSEERFRFDVSRQPGGTLLLRAATETRSHTIRLLKID
ncbi:hypothetical protein F5984_22665 [Rudanella paleaurantiibacter]|uniref:Dystroglycan-type cadherin-like domain-containing protein n=1 Tax=Rudanella paleaurantiibacter TaxID=2614655 RepID=A0A7J5TTZ7_9BACT|nr:putative Ig domain-containing protein [Rudanella paleaurantiibacter]KAB7727042.1 hypothetical protein F5984_22665 [Rudanella paleaurantiibacter]